MTPNIDILMVKLRTNRALRRTLASHKEAYKTQLYHNYGFGLTAEEFDGVVEGLIEAHWCFEKKGKNGAIKLVFNEAHNNVVGDQD